MNRPRCPRCGTMRVTMEYFLDNSWGLCGDRDCRYKGPTEEFTSAWVSVKERIPEFRKQVLSWDGKRQWVDYIESVTERRWHTRREITHWQPLHSPPPTPKVQR
jgi:hypothetical protein